MICKILVVSSTKIASTSIVSKKYKFLTTKQRNFLAPKVSCIKIDKKES